MAAEFNPVAPTVSPSNNFAPVATSTAADKNPSLAPKRQRRPSVRLGDIGGDKPLTSYRHPTATAPYHPRSKPSSSSSKTRPLTNLVSSNNNNNDYSSAPETNINGNLMARKAAKRPRTNFSRIDFRGEDDAFEFRDHEEEDAIHNNSNDFNKNHLHDDDDEEENHDEGNEEEEEEQQQSPVTVHSGDEGVFEVWHAHNRRSLRSNSNNNTPRVSDLGFRGLDNGVRKWLEDLGLARYAPVFEIHEVDDDVLPHLTLDDLKDMGINAVGSRRKLYAAILNLRKGLS